MNDLEKKKSAVDLTDLAVGVIVLGVFVSIGAVVLIGVRDSRLTSLPVFRTQNETQLPSGDVRTLTNTWHKSIVSVYNQTGAGEAIDSANYTVSVDQFGVARVTNTSANDDYNRGWNFTYDSYNTSQSDYKLANDAAVGLGEYGNWFKIIVIVGVAAVVLSLIFMAFGNRNMSGGGGGIGGEY